MTLMASTGHARSPLPILLWMFFACVDGCDCSMEYTVSGFWRCRVWRASGFEAMTVLCLFCFSSFNQSASGRAFPCFYFVR